MPNPTKPRAVTIQGGAGQELINQDISLLLHIKPILDVCRIASQAGAILEDVRNLASMDPDTKRCMEHIEHINEVHPVEAGDAVALGLIAAMDLLDLYVRQQHAR